MARMTTDNRDEATAAAPKRRAISPRTSVDEETRRALSASSAPDIERAIARLNAIAARIGPLLGPSALEDLRADRARDDDT